MSKEIRFKVAYVDDTHNNCEAMQMFFEGSGFDMHVSTSPVKLLADFPAINFDCIITDIHMPDMNGFEFYEALLDHPAYNKCPVFFISSDDSEINRIKTYDSGAVDFLSRFLTPQELISRVKSKIIFYRKHRSIREFGNIRVDTDRLKVTIRDEDIKLTFLEFKILMYFIRNYPDTMPKPDLIKAIWQETPVLDATVYTHIGNLQDKLKNWDFELVSVKSKGLHLKERMVNMSDRNESGISTDV